MTKIRYLAALACFAPGLAAARDPSMLAGASLFLVSYGDHEAASLELSCDRSETTDPKTVVCNETTQRLRQWTDGTCIVSESSGRLKFKRTLSGWEKIIPGMFCEHIVETWFISFSADGTWRMTIGSTEIRKPATATERECTPPLPPETYAEKSIGERHGKFKCDDIIFSIF